MGRHLLRPALHREIQNIRSTGVPGPDSISNLIDWWRTDDVDLNGSRISAVNRKVGTKDLAKSLADNQPLLLVSEQNGQDVAQHTDARNDQLNNSGNLGASAIPADSDWTVFYLFRVDGAWQHNKHLLNIREESSNNQFLNMQVQISPNRLHVEVAGAGAQFTHSGLSPDVWYVSRISYEDAAEEATSQVDKTTRKTAATGPYSRTGDDVYVPGNAVFSDFSWGDLFFYDRLLTSAEDQAVWDYFNSFWGLSL